MASNKWYLGSTIFGWDEMTEEEQEIALLEQELGVIRGRLNKLRETEETKQRYRKTIQKILDALGYEEVVMKGRSSDFLEVDEGEVAFLLSKHEQDRRLAKKVLLLTGFDEDEVEDILDNSDFEFVDGVLNLSSKEEADDDGV